MTTSVTSKGQVTIPESLRRKYGFLPGTRVEWIERDGRLYPLPVRPLTELFGLLKSEDDRLSLLDELLRERRADREREDE